MNNLSCEQVRANIVQEIVATERDYVKHLKDVVEVSVNIIYLEKHFLLLQRCQQLHIDLFPLHTVKNIYISIFSNERSFLNHKIRGFTCIKSHSKTTLSMSILKNVLLLSQNKKSFRLLEKCELKV